MLTRTIIHVWDVSISILVIVNEELTSISVHLNFKIFILSFQDQTDRRLILDAFDWHRKGLKKLIMVNNDVKIYYLWV